MANVRVAQAIIFDKSLLELRDFRCCPYASDPKKADLLHDWVKKLNQHVHSASFCRVLGLKIAVGA